MRVSAVLSVSLLYAVLLYVRRVVAGGSVMSYLVWLSACAPAQSGAQTAAPLPAPSSPEMQQFQAHWNDGKAEINHYAVTQARYGEPRKADVFLIFVTEPFNLEKQVKADDQPEHPAVAPVLKLNRIKKYQTGIYDYSLMTSVFAPVVPYTIEKAAFPAGAPIKIAFTSQEWCGTTFHQLNRQKSGMKSSSYSYFETENDRIAPLQSDANAFFADNIFLAVRELFQPLKETSVIYYPTLETVRLSHKALNAAPATISKKEGQRTYAGKQVATTEWVMTTSGVEWLISVEKAYPRRILLYQVREGTTVVEEGELKTSVRLPYWSLNKTNDESYLKQFKLNRTLAK
jgi:hypothetical protein